MASSFAATVGQWCEAVPEALLAVFRESAQELANQLTEQLASMVYEKPESPNYKRTQFLLSSLLASTTDMPRLTEKNPGVKVTPNFDQVEFVINNAELGETVFLGYTSEYGGYVHFGTSKMPPRPWVTMVSQRWEGIVAEKAAIVKKRFNL